MPFVLDLLRHGEALPPAESGDAARVLSPAGVASIRRLAEWLARDGWRPDRVFSSPRRRAWQTAEIVLAAVSPAPAIESMAELDAEIEPDETLAALAALGLETGHLLLVAHQPLLGRLTAKLTGREQAFSPGALVRVECRRGFVQGSGVITLAIRPEA